MAFFLRQRHAWRHLGDLCYRSSATTRGPLSFAWFATVSTTQGKTPAVTFTHDKGPNLCDYTPVRSSHLSSTVERGAYDDRVNQHVKGSDIKSVDLISDGRLVSITWGDGTVSKFHSVWLRFNCFCPQCRLDHTGQPIVQFDQVPKPSRLLSAEDDGEGCLVVQWKDDPGHTGILPIKFLKANCYSKDSLEMKRKSIRMTFSKDNVIPHVHYEEVMNSRRGVYKWVKALNETGIAIVDDVPCVAEKSMKLCQRIAACLQNTVYGETFEVKTVARPINAAYASWELKLHMDLVMYESPPGLQALHCIKFDSSIQGGDNFFVDLFQVAETFREKHPDDFDLLSRVPIPYETIHYKREWPVHMSFKRPMFRMNEHGDLTGIVWHPHLLGPLQVDEALVEPIYEALSKFYTVINNFPHQFQHRMKPGEMVIFNNRRILHGRRAFDNEDGERHLQGYYVDISEFRSCVQVLSNLEGEGRPPVRVGDNDWQ